jgi:hypothetical protein
MPTACLFGCSDLAHTAGTSGSMPWARMSQATPRIRSPWRSRSPTELTESPSLRASPARAAGQQRALATCKPGPAPDERRWVYHGDADRLQWFSSELVGDLEPLGSSELLDRPSAVCCAMLRATWSSISEQGIAVLEHTPRVLRVMLDALPAAWSDATEGPETWSPYIIVGHLIHAGAQTGFHARRSSSRRGAGASRPSTASRNSARVTERHSPICSASLRGCARTT